MEICRQQLISSTQSQPDWLQAINWQAPWLASVRQAAIEVLHFDDWREGLNQCIAKAGTQNLAGLPLHFIAQQDLPEGQAYEAHIAATGGVPTRDNLHDWFNALVWLSFPEIKRQLNALQAAQIAALGIGKQRGPARDAATLFDENAALLALPDTPLGTQLEQLLRQHQWQELFIQQRQHFDNSVALFAFGHALMEKLVQPYKAITAHCYVVKLPEAFFSLEKSQQQAQLDRLVAQRLTQQGLLPSHFTPLPVAGVPGWWPAQDSGFYADAQVFRPPRQAR